MTPTMVYGLVAEPHRAADDVGRRLNSAFQNRSLRIATCLPSGESSSSRKTRPSTGRARTIAKKPALTLLPRTGSRRALPVSAVLKLPQSVQRHALERPRVSLPVVELGRATGRTGVRSAAVVNIRTRRSGSSIGRGRSRTALTMLKIAVLAPMPSASTPITAIANDGVRESPGTHDEDQPTASASSSLPETPRAARDCGSGGGAARQRTVGDITLQVFDRYHGPGFTRDKPAVAVRGRSAASSGSVSLEMLRQAMSSELTATEIRRHADRSLLTRRLRTGFQRQNGGAPNMRQRCVIYIAPTPPRVQLQPVPNRSPHHRATERIVDRRLERQRRQARHAPPGIADGGAMACDTQSFEPMLVPRFEVVCSPLGALPATPLRSRRRTRESRTIGPHDGAVHTRQIRYQVGRLEQRFVQVAQMLRTTRTVGVPSNRRAVGSFVPASRS